MSRLGGKTSFVTGATSGLGAALAAGFWQEGSNLMLTGRRADRLEETVRSLAPSGVQRVATSVGDLARPEDCARIVAECQRAFGSIDVLINNAATQGPIGPTWENDPAQWEHTLAVNLLAPVALCRAYVTGLRRPGSRGKVINISGGGATAGRPRFSAYAASKAALVRFSETLADEVRSLDIDVTCVAPGTMATAMSRAVRSAGARLAGPREVTQAEAALARGPATLARAVALCVHLASEAGDGITGRLISAVWDPWESLAEHLEDLRRTDVYTIRRIVPRDRGLSWGGEE